MINLRYRFTAKQPIHTGSNEKLGILRTLRRQSVVLDDTIEIKSRFLPGQEKLKRQAAALLLLRLWDRMPNKDRPTIYEELASKVLASTSAPNKEEFLQVLCRRLDIRESTSNYNPRFDVVDILDLFDDEELLTLFRKESQYIIQIFRRIKNETIAWNKENSRTRISKHTLFGEITSDKSPEVLIQDQLEKIVGQPFVVYEVGKRVEQIPVIAGNSLRGLIRRLVMRDYLDYVGVKRLTPKDYHMLMTGGVISEDTGTVDIEKKRYLFKICPMLFLLGSAIGNQTIQGCLKVGQAHLVCKENGYDSLSYRAFIEILFGTRLDSLKLDNAVELDEGKDDETHQMLYEYEVFVKGAQFEHEFSLDLENHPFAKPTFYAMLRCFMDFGYITAKGSIGHGEIEIREPLTSAIKEVDPDYEDYIKSYYEHLDSHREEILAFWESSFRGKPKIIGDPKKITGYDL